MIDELFHYFVLFDHCGTKMFVHVQKAIKARQASRGGCTFQGSDLAHLILEYPLLIT